MPIHVGTFNTLEFAQMTLKKALSALAIIAMTCTFASAVDQVLTVTVLTTVEVTAPAAATLAKPEKTDANVLFDDTTWSVIANDIDGLDITFAAAPFLTTQGAETNKRDTKLDLSISSQIGYSGSTSFWSVGTASHQTDYNNATPVNTATVTATSTNAANAVFLLDVTFISGTYGTYASGTYTTTVTATIAGK